jgi:hypothetical protein
MTAAADSPAARALQAAQAQRWEEAAAIIAALIREEFALQPLRVEISRDSYSLNSVNGFALMNDGAEFFFKFHHEEGEEVTLQELYRGELLCKEGLPVDLPLYASTAVGRQLLLYRRRHERRFADACRALDFAPNEEAGPALRAQAALDELTGAVYLRTLHPIDADECAAEPVHQLFFHRLADPAAAQRLGGRARRFFYRRSFDLAGTVLDDARLRALRWRINGIDYADTLDTLLARALHRLNPRRLAGAGGVTAHGDAHNANVWWEAAPQEQGRLVLFDPAFAGMHVPALLAEVKATFHNIFAHPLWLYSHADATRRYHVSVSTTDSLITIDTDWRLTELRRAFLRSKMQRVWRPLLRALGERRLLPADWRETLRCALFCCPSLVMDPCAGGAGGHTPVTSALALAIAVRCGSEPAHGAADEISGFLDSIA